ncbi:MAG: dihydrofolate reductase [Saprospiraceae bacterium]|nr:dihydrofolate reductase [Saprospiraceae bacterium]
MRSLILNLALSLDGFIEGPNGEFDWCLTDQDYGMTDFLNRTDTVLMGRRSYDTLLSMGEDQFPQHQKYVLSRHLNSLEAPYRLLRGEALDRVRELKAQPGKDIWLFGGAELTTTLLEAGLVDEFMLAVHPLLLGSGKPLFPALSNRMPLQLLRADTFSSGMVQLFYRLAP